MAKSKSSDESINVVLNFPHSDELMSAEKIADSCTPVHGMYFQTTLQYYLETARFLQRHLQEDLRREAENGTARKH